MIADRSWVARKAVLTNARFPQSEDAKQTLAGPVLEERAIVGAHTTLPPGVRIDLLSLVGAGSVVTTTSSRTLSLPGYRRR